MSKDLKRETDRQIGRRIDKVKGYRTIYRERDGVREG